MGRRGFVTGVVLITVLHGVVALVVLGEAGSLMAARIAERSATLPNSSEMFFGYLAFVLLFPLSAVEELGAFPQWLQLPIFAANSSIWGLVIMFILHKMRHRRGAKIAF